MTRPIGEIFWCLEVQLGWFNFSVFLWQHECHQLKMSCLDQVYFLAYILSIPPFLLLTLVLCFSYDSGPRIRLCGDLGWVVTQLFRHNGRRRHRLLRPRCVWWMGLRLMLSTLQSGSPISRLCSATVWPHWSKWKMRCLDLTAPNPFKLFPSPLKKNPNIVIKSPYLVKSL